MTIERDERQFDIVDQAADALRRTPAPPAPPADVVAAIIAAGTEPAAPGSPIPTKRKIFTMKRIAKIAAAIVIVAGLAGLGVYMTVGGGGATLAWADVQKTIGSITSMRYRYVMTGVSIPDTEMRVMMKSPGKIRVEMQMAGHEGISIMDLESDEMITLTPSEKKAIRIDLHSMPPEQRMAIEQQDMLSQFHKMAEASPDGSVELPAREIDGRHANGYRVEQVGQTHTLWVDPYTGRPIEMEVTVAGVSATTIMTDFEFDVELDDSLFSTAIPDGYEVQDLAVDMSGPSIDDMVALFRCWTDASGGAFPDSLDPLSLAKEAEQSFPDPSKDKQLEITMVVTRAFMIITAHPEARYVGKGCSLGDAESPIFWYQPEPDGAYQMVYGDLRVEEIAEEDLPDAPAEDKPTIDDVVEVFRHWTEASGGAFPDALDIMSLMKQIKDSFAQKSSKEEMFELAMGWHSLLNGHPEARYVGKGRSLGDAESPIFWYQQDSGGAYQVIYGDLHVEEVAEEDLPSSE